MFIPNVLRVGEPGSGKSQAAARTAVEFEGAVVVFDPHKDSLARLVVEHAGGEVLFDRLSDLTPTLGYELLKPSVHPDPVKRAQQNERRAKLFVEVMMRRRGGDAATSPLLEEWCLALLLFFSVVSLLRFIMSKIFSCISLIISLLQNPL